MSTKAPAVRLTNRKNKAPTSEIRCHGSGSVARNEVPLANAIRALSREIRSLVNSIAESRPSLFGIPQTSAKPQIVTLRIFHSLLDSRRIDRCARSAWIVQFFDNRGNCLPQLLRIDLLKAVGWPTPGLFSAAADGADPASPLLPTIGSSAIVMPPQSALSSSDDSFVVIARGGLRLRSTPSESGDVARTLPIGTLLKVLRRDGDWALVDLQSDGQADGYVFYSYLKLADASAEPAAAVNAIDQSRDFSTDLVSRMFPQTPKANIAANLPFVLMGLRSPQIADSTMVLMALATIRAETEGFLPISEGMNKYNTLHTPFVSMRAGLATTWLGTVHDLRGGEMSN
ncbi:SH3 domain-containing protein [Rhizobium leguminosarum]|uniref:SH3 domain-containing protein n=1 Tax=Rhizobium leguminosarum TaxID=384 RepID=UPI00155ACA08|nr:SH3 domain-containing protein [Rhizobium leguminosarum]